MEAKDRMLQLLKEVTGASARHKPVLVLWPQPSTGNERDLVAWFVCPTKTAAHFNAVNAVSCRRYTVRAPSRKFPCTSLLTLFSSKMSSVLGSVSANDANIDAINSNGHDKVTTVDGNDNFFIWCPVEQSSKPVGKKRCRFGFVHGKMITSSCHDE